MKLTPTPVPIENPQIENSPWPVRWLTVDGRELLRVELADSHIWVAYDTGLFDSPLRFLWLVHSGGHEEIEALRCVGVMFIPAASPHGQTLDRSLP